MKTPAIAMLWECLARYPWLTIGLVVEFALLVVVSHVLPQAWLVDDRAIIFWIQFEAWFFIGIAAIFCVNANQPRTGRHGYPARKFLYPVSTFRLVAWPMVFGIAASVLAWFATVFCVLRPVGFRPPAALCAAVIATTMVWIQAMSWWPFRSSLTRTFMVCVALPTVGFVGAWPAYVWGWGEPFLWLILAIVFPPAFVVAYKGVALDRRGGQRTDSNPTGLGERFERLVEMTMQRRTDFASAAQAQFWYEWRTKGAGFLILVIGLAFISAVFAAFFVGKEPLSLRTFVLAMFIEPLYLSLFMGAMFARDEMLSKTLTISPFIATRPITSGLMADIKLRTSLLCVVASYGFVVAIIPLWLVVTGSFGAATASLQPFIQTKGLGPIVLAIVVAIALIANLAWKAIIGGMVPMLTGRPWVINVLVSCLLALGAMFVICVVWFSNDPDANLVRLRRLMVAVPWVLGFVLVLKLAIGTIAFRAALLRRMMTVGMCIGSAASWALVAAATFISGMVLLRPIPFAVALQLAFVAALIPPFGRLALAPLALNWGRHK